MKNNRHCQFLNMKYKKKVMYRMRVFSGNFVTCPNFCPELLVQTVLVVSLVELFIASNLTPPLSRLATWPVVVLQLPSCLVCVCTVCTNSVLASGKHPPLKTNVHCGFIHRLSFHCLSWLSCNQNLKVMQLCS
jgi:hypothetical protein